MEFPVVAVRGQGISSQEGIIARARGVCFSEQRAQDFQPGRIRGSYEAPEFLMRHLPRKRCVVFGMAVPASAPAQIRSYASYQVLGSSRQPG